LPGISWDIQNIKYFICNNIGFRILNILLVITLYFESNYNVITNKIFNNLNISTNSSQLNAFYCHCVLQNLLLFKQHVYCNYNITHLNKTFPQICMNRKGVRTVHQCIYAHITMHKPVILILAVIYFMFVNTMFYW
jgi:hypothetical protein